MARTKFPLATGNLIEIVGTVFSVSLVVVALEVTETSFRMLLYLISWAGLCFFPHCLTHFIVGRSVGIRFTEYSFGRSALTKLHMPLISGLASKVPVLTIRIERSSLQLASRGRRAVMFASGAAISMIMPFFAAVASVGHLPMSMSLFLFAISIGNFVFDFYYSPRAGDISRIKITE